MSIMLIMQMKIRSAFPKKNDEVIFLEIVENCGNWSKAMYWETYRTNLCKNKG